MIIYTKLQENRTFNIGPKKVARSSLSNIKTLLSQYSLLLNS
jgi:hypothetical protein